MADFFCTGASEFALLFSESMGEGFSFPIAAMRCHDHAAIVAGVKSLDQFGNVHGNAPWMESIDSVWVSIDPDEEEQGCLKWETQEQTKEWEYIDCDGTATAVLCSRPCTDPRGERGLQATPAPNPSPTVLPTPSPTTRPTTSPTKAPTPFPTASPTQRPNTSNPTPSPTRSPTKGPTASPTRSPTKGPTPSPTRSPTASPTTDPTRSPSRSPTTLAPTTSPTKTPTNSPTFPTASPTLAPTISPNIGRDNALVTAKILNGSTMMIMILMVILGVLLHKRILRAELLRLTIELQNHEVSQTVPENLGGYN